MGFSDEQRQKAAETRERNKAARLANGHASAAQTATLDPPAESTDGLAAALAGLTKMLGQAASKKAKQSDVIAQIEKVLAGIDPDEYPDIAKSEVVQSLFEAVVAQKVDTAIGRGARPGEIVWAKNPQTGLNMPVSKVPWHENHLIGMEMVTFTFDQPQEVFWNGIRRNYAADTEYTDYRCFPDLVREGRKNMRLGAEHVEYLMKKRNTLTDPSIAGVGTALVRGTADVGTYTPAGGLFVPDFEAGMTKDEEGEEGE